MKLNLRQPEELFYDAQATLRLVSGVLDDMRLPPETVSAGAGNAPGFGDWFVDPDGFGVPEVLAHTHAEAADLLHSIRQSRDVLERTSLESRRYLVSSIAASPAASVPNRSPFATAMVFGDSDSDSAQQLSYALSVLLDVESRLAGVVQRLDTTAPELQHR